MFTTRSSNKFFTVLFCLCSFALIAQHRIVIDAIPKNTPEGASIFMTGDFEGWSGGQNNYKLRFSEGRYSILLPDTLKSLSFKFTKGSWDQEEVARDGKKIANRSVDFSKNQTEFHFTVENWKDQIKSIATASKNVRLLSENFAIPQLQKTRRIWVYLPEDYEQSTDRYPVLYLQDGQNLFNAETSYSGEWEVDETLDTLFKEKDLKIIVIGIENAGADRINEYSPWKLKNYETSPKGDAYIQFITETLKPYVDKNYRSLKGMQHTGIMGSSLGGLISHYAAFKYPDTFGLAGVFSPSFELAPQSFGFTEENSPILDSKIYYMAGDSESPEMTELMQKMVSQIITSGFPEENINAKIVNGGKHNEKLWREQFATAVTWLFDTNHQK